MLLYYAWFIKIEPIRTNKVRRSKNQWMNEVIFQRNVELNRIGISDRIILHKKTIFQIRLDGPVRLLIK